MSTSDSEDFHSVLYFINCIFVFVFKTNGGREVYPACYVMQLI